MTRGNWSSIFGRAHKRIIETKEDSKWEENLFSALVDQKENVTNERLIEVQLVYYYQRIDTQDQITAGGISDIEDGYLLLSDLGIRALFSVYCAKGIDFD